MTTLTQVDASRVSTDAKQLVAEIEKFLASRPKPTAIPAPAMAATGFDLPSVEELIREAGIITGPGPRPEKKQKSRGLPGGLWKMLPDWTLTARRQQRAVSVAEHLQLTALVIQRYGWARRALRTPSGRRCILGAQAVLYRLGYGDEHSARAAGEVMDRILRKRGIRVPYHEWNDHPERTGGEALYLLREAAAVAGGR